MARLYDAIEPEVVSMSMLQRAVDLSRADGENQVIPKEEKLDYSEVRALRLDFRSTNTLCLINCRTNNFFRYSSNGKSLVILESDKITNG